MRWDMLGHAGTRWDALGRAGTCWDMLGSSCMQVPYAVLREELRARHCFARRSVRGCRPVRRNQSHRRHLGRPPPASSLHRDAAVAATGTVRMSRAAVLAVSAFGAHTKRTRPSCRALSCIPIFIDTSAVSPRQPAMSSDIIARVVAVGDKAEKLALKGHLLRAVENFGRAAEAARALGEDNLVAVHMRLQQGHVLGCHIALLSSNATAADPRIPAAQRSECIALLSGAVEALEHRRAAGALLEGKCLAAEEAWRAGPLQQDNPHLTAGEVAGFASLVGYEQFLYGATYVAAALGSALRVAFMCSAAQLQFFVQHVVHAAELMQQPRRYGDVALKIEAKFTYV